MWLPIFGATSVSNSNTYMLKAIQDNLTTSISMVLDIPQAVDMH